MSIEKKRFIQPYINPLKFTLISPVAIAQYVSKHMDDWKFRETILDWEQPVCFFQQWQTTDTVTLQFQSNYGPISLKLIRAEDDAVMHTVTIAQIRENTDLPGYYIYEVSLSLQAFDPGCYYFLIEAGNPVILTLISELIIISEKVENSLLLQYSHRKFYADVIFETGFQPEIRVPGIMKLKTPSSRDTTYEDQSLNQTMIKSIPFETWNLIIGLSEGIPPWLIKKLNRILGCSNLKIDGRLYTKSEGAKFEETAEDNYPMSGWRMEMREQLNRSSVIYETEQDQISPMTIMISADSKGFGAQTGSSNFFVEDII